jgi:hypothetical protein
MVKWHEITELVAKSMGDEPPPIFGLANPTEMKERSVPELFEGELRQYEPAITRRPDSGVLEIHIRGVREDRPGSFLEILLRSTRSMALREDQRLFVETRPQRSSTILFDLRSFLTQALPVLGPGGRVLVSRGIGEIDADVVVRKRNTEIVSKWVGEDLVLEPLRELISGYGDEEYVTVLPSFGYFELSKYEPQFVMRPAFVFMVQGLYPAEIGPSWLQTVVVPATTSPNVPLEEGLGSWID